MSTLRQKPDKLKYLSTVKTLDELHKEEMSKFISTSEKLEYLSKTGDILMTYYDMVHGSYYNSDVIEAEEKPIQTTKPASTEISQEMKKLNELSQRNRKAKKQIKKRRLHGNPGNCKSILQFMGGTEEEPEADDTEKTDAPAQNVAVVSTENISRATLQDKYLSIIDKNYACARMKTTKSVRCTHCNIEKIFDQMSGCYVCQSCGEEADCLIMENETTGYKDTNNDNKQKYPYKRMNHLKEKLNQFQSKETADVPDCVYEKIFSELKKKKIRADDASSKEIKAILKKNHMTNYYEHLQQIFCKITGCPPMTLTREIEERILSMFQSMQESFQTHCPKSRENFLNYSYVLNKLFRIIGLEKYSKYFGLLKSKEKLRGQDAIWTKICRDMKWTYFSSF